MLMNRIVLHHSGGHGTPSEVDKDHYHRNVDHAGVVHDGRHPISANALGRVLRAGTYAAHTPGRNIGSIGLAMA